MTTTTAPLRTRIRSLFGWWSLLAVFPVLFSICASAAAGAPIPPAEIWKHAVVTGIIVLAFGAWSRWKGTEKCLPAGSVGEHVSG